MWGVIARGMLLASVVAAGCGEPAARVVLVRSNPDDCGKPPTATGLKITAFAPGGEVTRAVGLDEHVDISDFPDDTEQLGVEVVIGGGEVGAVGKTFPLAFGDLADGARIPVFMTPLGGFCPTGPLGEARQSPVVARAGEGALVVGGTTVGGAALSTAELYDPDAAAFRAVTVPELLGQNGFVGTALTSMPDGRVVLSGGPQPAITVFDPVTMAFGELGFIEARSFHASVAIDDSHVLLAGGCSEVTNGVCTARKSSKIYDLGHLGTYEIGPNLRAARTGAAIFELGPDAMGAELYVAAGGVPSSTDVDTADRFTLAGDDAEMLSGTHARAALLDGGAVLTAFADDGTQSPAASVIVPGDPAAQPIANAPDLSGARLARLEDGRVLAVGEAGRFALYDPTQGRWLSPPAGRVAPTGVAAPTLLPLADGSVLVLDGGTGAWIYRDGIVGASSGAITVVPTSDTNVNVLTAPDPRTVMRAPGAWTLTSLGPMARALVGGPRLATGSVLATVRIEQGGAALIAQQVGPGRALVAELRPGSPARLVLGGDVVCTGATVPMVMPTVGVTLRLALDGSRARVAIDDTELLSCAFDGRERGAWGVAALGDGSRVTVATVTVAR